MSPKLTTAQGQYLAHLERLGPCPADPSYKPAARLLALGYVTREIRRNKMRLHIFTITEAGRVALTTFSTKGAGE